MQIVRLVLKEAVMRGPWDNQSPHIYSHDRPADGMVAALNDLGRDLRRLDDDYRSADPDRLTARVRSIITLSDQIGMRHVARVATDVARCSNSGDETALAATLSRLMRLLTHALDEAAATPHPF